MRHVEQALAGIYALQSEHKAGLDLVGVYVERLRHLLWNGYAAKASEIPCAIRRPVKETIRVNGKRFGPVVRRFLNRLP